METNVPNIVFKVLLLPAPASSQPPSALLLTAFLLFFLDEEEEVKINLRKTVIEKIGETKYVMSQVKRRISLRKECQEIQILQEGQSKRRFDICEATDNFL